MSRSGVEETGMFSLPQEFQRVSSPHLETLFLEDRLIILGSRRRNVSGGEPEGSGSLAGLTPPPRPSVLKHPRRVLSWRRSGALTAPATRVVMETIWDPHSTRDACCHGDDLGPSQHPRRVLSWRRSGTLTEP
ncbi:unnamed protein product [Boreogadus saida]